MCNESPLLLVEFACAAHHDFTAMHVSSRQNELFLARPAVVTHGAKEHSQQ